jgi:hypothetical protein
LNNPGIPVDPKFLEWVGQMLLLSAKNMEQADKFFKWFQEGSPAGKEWEQLLEPYLQLMPKNADKNTLELKNLFEQFFANMGIVSRAEYLELEKRYQGLKQEIDELKSRAGDDQRKGVDLFGQWAEMVKNLSESNARYFEEWRKLFIKPSKSEKKNE